MPILPPEADPVLIVDADAVLSEPRTVEPLQPIAGRLREFREIHHVVDLSQPPPCHRPEDRRTSEPRGARRESIEPVRGSTVGERSDHDTPITDPVLAEVPPPPRLLNPAPAGSPG